MELRTIHVSIILLYVWDCGVLWLMGGDSSVPFERIFFPIGNASIVTFERL